MNGLFGFAIRGFCRGASSRFVLAVVALALAGVCPGIAQAQYHWNNPAGGAFGDGNNWVDGNDPPTGGTAYFGANVPLAGAPFSVTFGGSTSVYGFDISSGTDVAFAPSGGSCAISVTYFVDVSDSRLHLANGTHVVCDDARTASSTHWATITVDGNATLDTTNLRLDDGRLVVGADGNVVAGSTEVRGETFWAQLEVQTGGSFTTDYFTLDNVDVDVQVGAEMRSGRTLLGQSSLSLGRATLHGGKWQNDQFLAVGYGGDGEFIQYGGVHSINGELWVGSMPGILGTYDLLDGNLSVTGAEYVGDSGWGGLVQSAGLHEVGGDLVVGDYSGWAPTGTAGWFDLLGGRLDVAGDEHVGGRGVGTFYQSGGEHTVHGDLTLGRYHTGSGSFELSDGNLHVAGDEHVGHFGLGEFTQTGGMHVIDGTLYVPHWGPGTLNGWPPGSYALLSGTLHVQTTYVGGALNVSEGNMVVQGAGTSWVNTGWLYIGGGTDGFGPITGGTGVVAIEDYASVRIGGAIKVFGPGALFLGNATLTHTDANLALYVENDGLVHVMAGMHQLGAVACSSSSAMAGTTQIDANVSLSVTKIVQDTLTIGAGATLTIRGSSATTNIIDSLSIDTANGGQLDLDDSNDGAGNILVLPGATYSTVAEWVRSGRNDGTGIWTGPGIISSVAQDPNTFVAVGVIDNAQFTYSTFGDATGLDGNEVLLKCTWLGDADLKNGTETFDLLRWLDGYNGVGTGWAYGDFDYSGGASTTFDLLRWLDGYNATQAQGEMVPQGGSPIPEPATLVLLSIGGVLVAARRRKTRL